MTSRCNDGKPDGIGHLWVGTMAREGAAPVGGLYRVDSDGAVRRYESGLRIANGLDWSPDGRTMYHIDSMARSVRAYDFDPASGTPSGRRVVIDFHGEAGLPDGLCVDADGGVWVALWGGGEVRRYEPDGRVTHVVRTPVSRPTSCTFGGPGLGTLLITSASEGLDAAALRDEPHAGGVFGVEPGVHGLPARRWQP